MHPTRPSLPMKGPRPAALILALAAAHLAAAAPAASQEAADNEARAGRRVNVAGSVVDAATGLPLREVAVRIAQTDKFSPTDLEGRFALYGVPSGGHLLVVERLGYRTRAFVLEAQSDTVVGQIPLQPDPIMLEALKVTVDHFDRRVERYGSTVRVLTRDQILGSAITNTRELVLARTLLRTISCGSSPLDGTTVDPHATGANATPPPTAGPVGAARPSFAGECFAVRGLPVQPGVFIDEIPIPGGLEDLSVYRTDEIARIEILGGGRQVRIYTTAFMERAARRRYRPNPIVF